jgi:hypothetical protein
MGKTQTGKVLEMRETRRKRTNLVAELSLSSFISLSDVKQHSLLAKNILNHIYDVKSFFRIYV